MNYKSWNWQTDYTGQLLLLNEIRRARVVAFDVKRQRRDRYVEMRKANQLKEAVAEHLERN